jgi:Holliday junction DNA helicase RuvA
MIAYLKGYVRHVTGDGIILDVKGVGYYVLCPTYLLRQAQGAFGDELVLWCVMQVREDANTLYGFEHNDGRVLFMAITRISGVGGRLALNLFSELGFHGLLEAILTEDVSRFQKADGVGPKMAKRLAIELKNQEKALLGKFDKVLPLHTHAPAMQTPQLTEALSALKGLGYSEQEVRPLATSLVTDDPTLTTETLLQQTLQRLSTQVSNA